MPTASGGVSLAKYANELECVGGVVAMNSLEALADVFASAAAKSPKSASASAVGTEAATSGCNDK